MGDKLRTRGSAGSGAAATVAMLALLAGCAGSTRKPATSPSASGSAASAPVTTPAEVRSLDLQARGPGAVLRVAADRPLVWTNYRDRDGNLVVGQRAVRGL